MKLTSSPSENHHRSPPGASGTGNISLPISAVGTSYGSGAGNLILQFATSVSAIATLTYTYDCGTPVNDSTWGRIKNLF